MQENLLPLPMNNGGTVKYDPRRLTGVSGYRETGQPFAVGDRLQFTAPDKTIAAANRGLGTIEQISAEGNLAIRLENGRKVAVSPSENRISTMDMRSPATAPKASGQTGFSSMLIETHTRTRSIPGSSTLLCHAAPWTQRCMPTTLMILAHRLTWDQGKTAALEPISYRQSPSQILVWVRPLE